MAIRKADDRAFINVICLVILILAFCQETWCASADEHIDEHELENNSSFHMLGNASTNWLELPQSPTNSKLNPMSRIPGNCSMSPLEFDCGDGICISIKQWRDCHADCPMGVDEECWENQIRCDGCKCVDPGEEDIMCRKN